MIPIVLGVVSFAIAAVFIFMGMAASGRYRRYPRPLLGVVGTAMMFGSVVFFGASLLFADTIPWIPAIAGTAVGFAFNIASGGPR
jgi:hypothetical protein